MKRLAIGLLAPVLALCLLVLSPQRAEATVFGCADDQYVQYGNWETHVLICAEHLGDGHYRSWVRATTYNWITDQFVAVNYRFRGQQLFYYCNSGTCRVYDYVTNDGYVGVVQATSYGKKVTCPGASNRGKVMLSALDIRYPDNALVTWDDWDDATNIPFNSNC
jgi:hypothetical protein